MDWYPDPTVTGTLRTLDALVLEYTWAGSYRVVAGDLVVYQSALYLRPNSPAAIAAHERGRKAQEALFYHGMRPRPPLPLRELRA